VVNPFESRATQKKEEQRNPEGSPFQRRARDENIPQEPWYKELARTLYQIPSGIAQAATYPLDIVAGISTYGAMNEEELDELERAFEKAGKPFDREQFKQGILEESQNFPTQSNLERMIEEKTGLPLTPQSGLQKGLKFASSAGKITPGTLSQKVVGGATAEGVNEALQAAGVPEGISEVAAFPAGMVAGAKSPAVSLGKATKPSGLPVRKFESVKSMEKVPESKISKINENLEKDFKGIADKIFEESPIYDVQSAMKEGPLYKQNVVESFEQVQNLANQLPETISSKDITKRLESSISPKRSKGFMDSEADSAYKKVVEDLIKKSPEESEALSAGQLVEQYRKNNAELSKLFEPGQSKAYNAGKAEAYLDYNKAIAETIEDLYPNSEFSTLFKDSNKKWAQIKDAEAIDSYLDKVFEGGKVNFKEARKAIEGKSLAHSMERSLGKKGYQDFKTLVNDLMSVENPLKNLKGVPAKGIEEYARSITPFLLSKNFGRLKFAADAVLNARRNVWEFMLDKPKFKIEWKNGVKALKSGDPIKAKRIFDDLSEEIKSESPEVKKAMDKLSNKEEAVKKFNEHRKESKG
jgi:hypothetical protein